MSFSYRPAVRDSTKLLIGLVGPSGCGKTLSALRLATGLGGSICFLDTEQGRALQYAAAPGTKASPPDSFDFLHGSLAPPLSSDRYLQAVEAAIQAKPDVLIIDSMSHEWEGPGGILDEVDAAKNAGAMGGNEFAVWAKPKQKHNKLIQTLLQVPAHVILCMRAKEKRAIVEDPERPRKKIIVSLGWHPIAESGLTYELTINLLLGTQKKGAPTVEGFDFGKLPFNMVGIIKEGEQITEETGRRLADWAKGAAIAAPAPKPAKKLLQVFDAEGGAFSSVPRAGEWLAAYRACMQSAPDRRNEIIERNIATLEELAGVYPAEFGNELLAARDVLDNAGTPGTLV
jgi:hypothetical protein